MDFSKSILLPLGAIAIVGACAPYPPSPYPGPPQPEGAVDGPQDITSEQQRQIDENKARLERQAEERKRDNERNAGLPDKPAPPKAPKYPTASVVPGKSGFVFNPYTHNIVDVKGIASGTKVKDPDDSDPTHIFRVP